MNTKEEVEKYKTASIWSFHILQGIQAKIENEMPDLKKEKDKSSNAQ